MVLAQLVELPRGLNVVYALDTLNDPISNPFALPLARENKENNATATNTLEKSQLLGWVTGSSHLIPKLAVSCRKSNGTTRTTRRSDARSPEVQQQ